jgi:hypothetical protein
MMLTEHMDKFRRCSFSEFSNVCHKTFNSPLLELDKIVDIPQWFNNFDNESVIISAFKDASGI